MTLCIRTSFLKNQVSSFFVLIAQKIGKIQIFHFQGILKAVCIDLYIRSAIDRIENNLRFFRCSSITEKFGVNDTSISLLSP
jgi:hypothetical protein